MYPTLPLALLSLLPLTLATNIPITVGASGQLAFNPNVVTANPGDKLTFSYFPKNHSVVQSSFQAPCAPLANGFFSGFQPLSAGPGPVEFVVTVNDTKPIWIYCAQTEKSHCQSGMAMVVNQPAPPSPNTLTAYKAAAAKTNVSTAPPHIAGGVFIPLNGTSATGTSTGTASKGVALSTGAGTSTSTSTVIPFTGAAERISSGVMAVVLGAAGVAGLAFL